MSSNEMVLQSLDKGLLTITMNRPDRRNALSPDMTRGLVEAAQRSWRRLDGHNQLPKLILGVKFTDGLEVAAKPANRQPATAAA